MLTFGSVVIGVDELPRASAFWQQALGYRPREEPDDSWAILVPRDGTAGPQLALMLSPSDADDDGSEGQHGPRLRRCTSIFSVRR